jgi:hypothetical protein
MVRASKFAGEFPDTAVARLTALGSFAPQLPSQAKKLATLGMTANVARQALTASCKITEASTVETFLDRCGTLAFSLSRAEDGASLRDYSQTFENHGRGFSVAADLCKERKWQRLQKQRTARR